MNLDTDLQLRLRALRGEWGPIAKHADVSVSWVSKFTRGHIPNPGIHTLRKLAIAIDTLGLKPTAKKKVPAAKRARRTRILEGPTPQHVLKAEPGALQRSADATDRGESHGAPGRRTYGHLASRRRGPAGER